MLGGGCWTWASPAVFAGVVLLPLHGLCREHLHVQQHLGLLLEPDVVAGEDRLWLLGLGGELNSRGHWFPRDFGPEIRDHYHFISLHSLSFPDWRRVSWGVGLNNFLETPLGQLNILVSASEREPHEV